MAHPVRPASYMEISNFYTLTIYEKGAEVVRMIHTLLGPDMFRKGSDLYFERHDGQAVTTDDFVKAMEDASGRDLSQFRLWIPRDRPTKSHSTFRLRLVCLGRMASLCRFSLSRARRMRQRSGRLS